MIRTMKNRPLVKFMILFIKGYRSMQLLVFFLIIRRTSGGGMNYFLQIILVIAPGLSPFLRCSDTLVLTKHFFHKIF